MPAQPVAANRVASVAYKVAAELGLVSLHEARRDVKVLCAQRFVRLFAYGASTLVLANLLRELGVSTTRIGLFMTLTLVGDVAISLVLALFSDRLGRRAVLAAGAVLMAGSGLVFARASNYWLLLTAAIFGVISPGGNEIGPFRAIEEAIIADATGEKRADVYAWYTLIGTAGTALGIMTCGWATDVVYRQTELDLAGVYRLIFYAYTILGLVKALLVGLLTPTVDRVAQPPAPASSNNAATETDPLLGNEGEQETTEPLAGNDGRNSWLPQFTEQSLSLLLTLCLLFGLDSFASGLAPLSWVTYFFKTRYDLSQGTLGSIFFVTSIIAAASTLVASSLARRFGNIQTMVFTHLPSAIFLSLIAVFDDVRLATLFLVLRACTQSMDVAPRSAFLAAVLAPHERTAAVGLINGVKTTAQSLGPLLTGVLADANLFWVAFVCAGSLKASYDLGLLAIFANHERQHANHQAADEDQDQA